MASKIEMAIMALLVIAIIVPSSISAYMIGIVNDRLKSIEETIKPPTPVTPTKLLRVGFAWPTMIDPAVGSDYSSSTSFTNLYDPFVFPTTTGDVKAWVAANWTVSTDGLTWTFTIRSDIKFHSNRTLKAEDVRFTMERLITIGEGYSYLFSP